MNNFMKPELLAPAGDFERLNAAIEYGADAVYLGSDCFGMRTAAASFGGDNLRKACEIAHKNRVKVYLTCNTVPRNNEFESLPDFLRYASESGVDAFIITDLGVMEMAKKYAPEVEIHISTQAGITNYASANAFYNLGAKRIVTAREISLEEIAQIRANVPADLEIESFVHGAMCVSFSGRCLLSNYLTGRDSNRGDCAQPCRWRYALAEEKRPGQFFPLEQDSSGTYIMNSRDMSMIEHVAKLAQAGISSFKIEGRAKSAYYTAVSVNAYRCAIDGYVASGYDPEYVPEQWIIDEVRKASNRQYCTGFYFGDPMDDAEIFYHGGYVREWDVAAIAQEWNDGVLYASQRNRFFEGDELEVMIKGVKPVRVTVKNLKNAEGESITNAPHPMMDCSFECPIEIPKGSYLRLERKEGVIL